MVKKINKKLIDKPLTLQQLMNASMIKASKPEDIPLEKLAHNLNKYSFALIRGIIDSNAINESKKKILSLYNPDNDRPATGESPSDIMKNYQKLSIGGAEHGGVYRPRCMRTFYNPIWDKDIYGLRDSFIKTAQVRNLIYGFNIDYAIKSEQDNFWTASRIHNYPAGGGFLVPHVDNVVPVVQKAEGISQYFQPVLVMSKKGKGKDCDFVSGGGFIELNDVRYYYEEFCELGDIVIYSGATIHGVADIDLHKPFDNRIIGGRFAGFVTIYKEFTKKNELGKYISGIKRENPID
jgi:hypothetical protein